MTPDDWNDDWIIGRIEEYLDGDLPDDEREEMERRIAEDPAVRAEIDDARRFRHLAREAGSLPIPEELGERIRERVARDQSTSLGRTSLGTTSHGGRVVLLRRLVTVAVAAAIIILIFRPIETHEPSPGPVVPVVRLGEPGTPSPRVARSLLADWLDQARNLNPADADLLRNEAGEFGLLAMVRSRLDGARGRDRAFLLAAEDLLIQVENGISPEALPMEAQMVAMARN